MVVALFVAAAWAQAVWGWLVATRPARWVLYAGIALSGGAIAVWAISRTVGLDIGTHATGAAEPVGVKDAVTVAFELVILVGAVALLGSRLDSIRVDSRAFGRRALGCSVRWCSRSACRRFSPRAIRTAGGSTGSTAARRREVASSSASASRRRSCVALSASRP